MSNFEKRYQQLNERQKEAVDAIDGPVLVVAGPGSGKTELLGLRVANILRSTDARAADILCLTFTEAAARNMRERLAGLIGQDAYKVAIHTFHSFGSEIINRHPEAFYQGAVYAPIDEISKTEIIEEIIKNLPWRSRLKSYHPTQGYTYLRDIISRIDDIKKGGLSPEEFGVLIAENRAFEEAAGPLFGKVFAERVSLALVPDVQQLLSDLAALPVTEREHALGAYRTLQESIVESLEGALLEVEATEEKKAKTKPLTTWKKNFLKKNAAGKWLLASHFRSQELSDLAQVYAEYQQRIHAGGFYDFADMILDTVQELESSAELRYELQEKYLYVLVDEFQDTSGVQMRLLDAILNPEVNEGRPNVLAVGDDDQSIYKFQGASLQNVDIFLHRYRDVRKIVLTHNYRSTQEILDYSQSVIGQAQGRLASQDPSIVKELIAANVKIPAGAIAQKEFATRIEEYIFVAEEIGRLKAQHPDQEIAVISRKHSDLEELSRLLNYYQLPVAYERSRDILEEKHIQEIITLARFINSLNVRGQAEADELLPDILSFSFLGIDRLDLWKISSSVHRSRPENWLEAMLAFGGQPQRVAEFLIALGTEAKRRTLEETLDFITGVKQMEGVAYRSGFKEFYFSAENFQIHRLRYLEYLFDLKTLFASLRAYRQRQTLYLGDLVDFVALHQTHRLPLHQSQHLRGGCGAVSLLTAHKAKGLEFDSVFILSCNENAWMKSRSGGKLSFPPNVPLAPEKDDSDDQIRLFFVAVTRAKSRLYLTNFCSAEGEKKSSDRLRFLDPDLSTSEIEALPTQTIRSAEEVLLFEEELHHYEIENADEAELLRSLLEGYQLSVTHLHNFLDVTAGGPAKFLESNLLRFPSAPSPASSYGTAIHGSFQEFYKRFKEQGQLPAAAEFLHIFEEKLKLQPLSSRDFSEKLEQGREELGRYYAEQREVFDARDLLEVDFKSEGVMIDGCPVTGKIDRLSLVDETAKLCRVYDYKTGKPFSTWSPSDDYLKIKAYKYKDQLTFYKLLIENSRSFGKYRVERGSIDFLTSAEDRLLQLELEITAADVERLTRLIAIVHRKILALDFPDVSSYSANYQGIRDFEADLLAGNI